MKIKLKTEYKIAEKKGKLSKHLKNLLSILMKTDLFIYLFFIFIYLELIVSI